MSDQQGAAPAEAGPVIYKGLAGVPVDYTAVSKVNPETNSLLYRGYPVQELAASVTFEEVAYLLWYGELPDDTQLADVGVNLVIWPVSLLRIAMGAAGRALDTLNDEGSLTSKLGEMQHRADLYELIDYEGYNRFDTSVFNFTIDR